MWRLFVVIFSSCVVSSLGGKCTFHFDSASSGIFTQKFGSKTKLLWPQDGMIKFDDRSSISAYCPGTFDYYDRYGSMRNEKNLKFTCSGNQVQVIESGSNYNYDSNRKLMCRTTSQYWEGDVKGCSDQGLVFGFFVNEAPIVIANVCYGSDVQRTWFIHYMSGLRSPLVENQQSFNLANLSHPAVDVLIDSRLDEEKQSLEETITKALPNYAGGKLYQIDDLVPLSSASYLESYTKDLESTNKIAWWIPLKYGNWKLLEEAINRASANYTLDVYAGISGHVIYPVHDRCDSIDVLSYGDKVFRKSVPLYVWNYIKRSDSEEDKGVVILGINSPFFEASEANKLLCEDICDTIRWLDYLKKWRKMPGLGYIFCCNPDDVKDKLEGFPKF